MGNFKHENPRKGINTGEDKPFIKTIYTSERSKDTSLHTYNCPYYSSLGSERKVTRKYCEKTIGNMKKRQKMCVTIKCKIYKELLGL